MVPMTAEYFNEGVPPVLMLVAIVAAIGVVVYLFRDRF